MKASKDGIPITSKDKKDGRNHEEIKDIRITRRMKKM